MTTQTLQLTLNESVWQIIQKRFSHYDFAKIVELAIYSLIREQDDWLSLAEPSFSFWDNEVDAIYDNL